MSQETWVFPGSECVPVEEVFEGLGYTSPKDVANKVATVSLWLSVVGLLLIVVQPISFTLGLVGYARSRRSPDNVGHRESLAAIVLSVLGVSLWGILWGAVNVVPIVLG